MNIKCKYDLSGKSLFETHRAHNKMPKKFSYTLLHVNEPLDILNEKKKPKSMKRFCDFNFLFQFFFGENEEENKMK